MNSKLQGLLGPVALLALLLVLAGPAISEEVGMKGFADAALTVNVIVDIDKDTRLITLKDDAGEKWDFVAGPEVQNFDQLKRGDVVIMEYFSGFAIALEPKGSGLEDRVDVLEVERAKKGEKPGVKVTDSTYVLATVKAVDVKNGTATVEGPLRTLVLKAGEDVDLEKVEVGQEIEALYTESYAVSVQAAPEVSGTVTLKAKSVAVGVGFEWGEGKLTMYDGTEHEFKVKGMTMVDVGASTIEAKGEVYNLVEAKDIEGLFWVGEAGAVAVGGGSALAMTNQKGVVMNLLATQKGARLTLAGEGLNVSLK